MSDFNRSELLLVLLELNFGTSGPIKFYQHLLTVPDSVGSIITMFDNHKYSRLQKFTIFSSRCTRKPFTKVAVPSEAI